MAWCVRRSISCGRRRRCRTLIYAALPVSIVGLQDADKVRHAGLIPVIGRDWHLKIGAVWLCQSRRTRSAICFMARTLSGALDRPL